MTQKHHDLIASLENDVAITLNSEDNVHDSSDDESYNIDSDSSSSDDDDDDLSGVVNISNVNLRKYGPPKSAVYNVHNMITAVKIIQQQELGIVRSLTEKKVQSSIFQKYAFSDKTL